MQTAVRVPEDKEVETEDGERPAACATQRPKRLQDELDAADARLRQAAQNFSVEWKAFLAYAMKIKQETADFASFPDKNALEDLLLRSQSGLVMLREMDKRRQDKWRDVLPWHDDRAASQQTMGKAPRRRKMPVQESVEMETRHAAFCTRYTKFLRRQLRLCYCYVTRKRLVPTLSGGSESDRTILHRGMTKLLQQGLATLQTLEADGSSINQKDSRCCLRRVQHTDIESYVRFLCLQQQYGVVFDRFLIRLRWLLKSHRYHIRQRMLDLCYQQQARTVALPPSALLQKYKVSPTVSDGMQCPRFPLTSLQVENELRSLLSWLGIQATGHAMAIKLRVEEAFDATISATTLGPSASDDSSSQGHDSPSLISKSLLRSRWSLLQLGSVLEDVAPVLSEGKAIDEDQSSASFRVNAPERGDVLLHNEWQLVQLNDAAYLKSRLDGQTRSHLERALVDVAKSLTQSEADDKMASIEKVAKNVPVTTNAAAAGLTAAFSEELLDAFYKARFLVCRRKRQRLLRALNYLHYIRDTRRGQAVEVAKLIKGRRTLATRSSDATGGADWSVEKREGDFIVTKDRVEFIFDIGWRDLKAVEEFLLDIASVFIEKEQSVHLVEAQASGQHTTAGSIMLAIDRMQVLCDVYDCESQFLHTKIDTVLQLLATGSEFTVDGGIDYIGSFIERRPQVDLTHAYFSESYASEALLLDLRRQLIWVIQDHKDKVRVHDRDPAVLAEEEWLHDHLLMEAFTTSLISAEQEIRNEANTMWLVPTTVSERHAMQQALLEKTILVWKSIVMAEVSMPLSQSLECTKSSMLSGSAWCISFTPALVSNASMALSTTNNSSLFVADCPLDEACLVEVIELLKWRRRLGIEVYETRVLEEIYEYQRGFVGVLESRKIDEPSLFSCDLVTSDHPRFQMDKPSFLVPLIALLKTKADESRGKSQRPGRHKQTVRDWMEAALHERLKPDRRMCFDRELRVQSLYKWCLVDKVQYHDLVSREIVEFAATAPFFFLASSIARHGATGDASDAMAATNLRAVKWKYMDEIIDRIRQVAEETCTPRCVSLESLRTSLFEQCHFDDADQPSEETAVVEEDEPITVVVDVTTLERLDKICEETNAIPRLVVELDCALRPLRNEKKLMEDLFPHDVEGRCAFHARSAPAAQTPSSALSSWLSQKLDQLKQDLQTKQEKVPSNGTTTKLPPGRNSHLRRRLSTRRSSFLEATADAIDSSLTPAVDYASLVHHVSEDAKLLLEIPSTEQLLEWFIGPANASHTAGTAVNDENGDKWEADQASLRALIEIYNEFAAAVSLLRVESSFGFHLYANSESAKQRIRRRASTLSGRLQASSSAVLGLELFKGWQVALHRSLKRFHDRVVEHFEPHVIAKMDLFAVFGPDDVRKRHQLMTFRWELSGVIHDLTTEWRQRVRCAAIGIMIESFAVCVPPAGDRPQHFRDEQRSVQLLLAHELSSQSTQTKDNAAAAVAEDRLLFLRSHAVAESSSLRGFWQLLLKTHDTKHLETLAEWLSLVYAQIQDNVARQARGCQELGAAEAVKRYEELAVTYRIFHRVQVDGVEHPNSSEMALQPRYPDDEVDEKARRVSGTRLRMQTPDCVKAPSSTQADSLFSRVVAAVLEITKLTATSQASSANAGGLISLPTITRLTLHADILRVRLTVQWMDDDISLMQSHYESFLVQKRKFHLHQQQRRGTASSSVPSGSPATAANSPMAISLHKRLLDFSPYYRPAGQRHSMKPQEQSSGDERGEFVVPEQKMVAILNAFTRETNAFYEQILASEANVASKLDAQCVALRGEVDQLRESLVSQNQDEALKREMFAVDKSYALQFQLHRQRKEMALLENRLALEQQILKQQLVDEFEQRLSDMHVQLLAKQHQFDVYRQVMQQDLKLQLQAAQSHLVHQLVDHSGVMAIETKTSFLESLQGQAAQDQLQKENVALKQTILKLQTLYDMQEQMRAVQSEKERVAQDTQRMQEAQLTKENSHLQHQIGQLEAEMAKLSQDRTFHRIKLANLQKQNDAESQRRREAKIRSLSASYRRNSQAATPESMAEAPASERTHVMMTPNQDDDEEAFERLHAIKIRSPRAPSAPASTRVAQSVETTDIRKLDDSHLRNTTQHYQNEIKRLQQQLAKEMKIKSALMEQITQLKEEVSNIAEAEEQGEVQGALSCDPARRERQSRYGLASASPRTRAVSASVCSPRQSKAAVLVVPRRPSTSFSPRVKSAGASARPQSTMANAAELSALSPAPTPPSNRKFDVQQREPSVVKVGGIAGVQNALSAREKLPYR